MKPCVGRRRRTRAARGAQNAASWISLKYGFFVSSCVCLVGDEVGLERGHPVLAEARRAAGRSTGSRGGRRRPGACLRNARCTTASSASNSALPRRGAPSTSNAQELAARRRRARSRGRSRSDRGAAHIVPCDATNCICFHSGPLSTNDCAQPREARCLARRERVRIAPVDGREPRVEQRVALAVDARRCRSSGSIRCSSARCSSCHSVRCAEQRALDLELEDRGRLLHARHQQRIAQVPRPCTGSARTDRRRTPSRASFSSGASGMP